MDGLEESLQRALPLWPGSNLGLVGVDRIPVKLTTSSVDIDLVKSEPSALLPEVTDDPEEQDDEDGEPFREEDVGGSHTTANWL
jgi:hypothetical protein